MLTTPRAVTERVRIWAGLAAPSRIGPTGSASASMRVTGRRCWRRRGFGMTSTLASPFRRDAGSLVADGLGQR